jgi:hypothetical protein
VENEVEKKNDGLKWKPSFGDTPETAGFYRGDEGSIFRRIRDEWKLALAEVQANRLDTDDEDTINHRALEKLQSQLSRIFDEDRKERGWPLIEMSEEEVRAESEDAEKTIAEFHALYAKGMAALNSKNLPSDEG